MTEPNHEITQLVIRWSRGEEGAFDQLMTEVYDELRQIARHHLQLGRRDGALNTTVLVHEAYLRLARVEEWDGLGRVQFFAFCSRAMRHVLVDFARRQRAAKRGGAVVHIELRDDVAAVDDAVIDFLVVEEALEQLESKSERMARVFECRHFGGMSVRETAEALGTSERTVGREWARARAYLRVALESGNDRPLGDRRDVAG